MGLSAGAARARKAFCQRVLLVLLHQAWSSTVRAGMDAYKQKDLAHAVGQRRAVQELDRFVEGEQGWNQAWSTTQQRKEAQCSAVQ